MRGRPARLARDASFYAHKAASGLVELVNALVPQTLSFAELSGEKLEWARLRAGAKRWLKENQESRPRSLPQLEEQPLGSAEGLAATDDAVHWDRITRDARVRA